MHRFPFWPANRFELRGKMRHGPHRVNIFKKNIEPSAQAATPMSVETNIPDLDRPKKESCISDRCCAPHPPCIDLIDPPGHPLSGRAHFWTRRSAVGRAKSPAAAILVAYVIETDGNFCTSLA